LEDAVAQIKNTKARPVKVEGREFHTLSEAEKFCALLALYHPDCWDVHEQFVLFPGSQGPDHPPTWRA
jgi:hypothetical protein